MWLRSQSAPADLEEEFAENEAEECMTEGWKFQQRGPNPMGFEVQFLLWSLFAFLWSRRKSRALKSIAPRSPTMEEKKPVSGHKYVISLETCSVYVRVCNTLKLLDTKGFVIIISKCIIALLIVIIYAKNQTHLFYHGTQPGHTPPGTLR